ncbi:MAG: glycerol-3-phosphate 1-O-acyltransferase PlsY [Dorea sp.]|nr:glycerol-3-phosphate 1-O-acyltransferase PlsY [Dorea sp.]
MERLICLAIGYAFGLIQTGYLYGKSQNVDIRKMGSGNAGATNALRTLGWKAGAITFFGDAFKCIFAIILTCVIFRNSQRDILMVLSMYTGMGAVLGHNYPFYMHFKGGKGIAVTAGLIASTTNSWTVVLCLAVFAGIVAGTRYVSVGSMTVVVVYFISVVILGQAGYYKVTGGPLYEIYAIVFLLVVSAFFKHRANIKRLLAGTENKLSVGKKS